MTNKNKNRQIRELGNFIFESIKINKFMLIIFLVISIITLFTGIIIAAKTHSSIMANDNFGLVDITTGGLTTTFFTRLLSMMFMVLILFGCSFTIYVVPISIIFISYRSYLLGLNICLMIINYGFSGALISIIVAFPCQLIAIGVMILYYVTMLKTNKDYKAWGGCRTPYQRLKILIITIIVLLLLCLLESLLLAIFSAKVILVI